MIKTEDVQNEAKAHYINFSVKLKKIDNLIGLTLCPPFSFIFLLQGFHCSFPAMPQSIITVTKKVGREGRGGANLISQFHSSIAVSEWFSGGKVLHKQVK